MKADIIIDALNSHIEMVRKRDKLDGKSFFVLQKNIEPTKVAKAYKTYIYTVWLVDEGKKIAIGGVRESARVITIGEENALEVNLMLKLIEWTYQLMESQDFYSILIGKFNGYGDTSKQISDTCK